jgi:hypothetical protein
MDPRRQIVYTKSAQSRLDKLQADIIRHLESELIDRKFIPGDEQVEITASDVEEISRAMLLSFADPYERRARSRNLLISVYMVVGVLMTVAGLFYQDFIRMVSNPTQGILVLTGASITVAGFLLRLFYRSRSREVTKLREAIRGLEERK